MSQPESMLIEFYGPPGVGKSSIARELNIALQKRAYKTTNKTFENSCIDRTFLRNLNKFKYICHSHRSGSSSSIKLYKLIEQTDQHNRNRLLNLFLYSHFLRGILRSVDRINKTHILDQGILQLYWAIQYSGSNSFSPTELFQQYPTFDEHIIVHVTAGVDTIFDRLLGRNDGRSRIEGQELTRSTVETVTDDIQSVFDFVDTQSKLTGITIQNDGSIEEASKSLLTTLDELGHVEK